MKLNRDFKEFIQLLAEHDVRYMIVGGYAVAFYGHPRYTKDLDIWLWVDAANAKHIVEVLKIFGFASLGLTEQDFLMSDNVIQLGFPPVRIDLIMSITGGLQFDECYDRRVVSKVDGIMANFISLEDLKTNKRASGRSVDLDDVEKLQ